MARCKDDIPRTETAAGSSDVLEGRDSGVRHCHVAGAIVQVASRQFRSFDGRPDVVINSTKRRQIPWNRSRIAEKGALYTRERCLGVRHGVEKRHVRLCRFPV